MELFNGHHFCTPGDHVFLYGYLLADIKDFNFLVETAQLGFSIGLTQRSTLFAEGSTATKVYWTIVVVNNE